MKRFWVYIMSNPSHTLYVGIANNLLRRLHEHKTRTGSHFTGRYRVNRLVYCEATGDVRAAIAREKQTKGWRREKKVSLIESANPLWADLATEWAAKADSSLRSE